MMGTDYLCVCVRTLKGAQEPDAVQLGVSDSGYLPQNRVLYFALSTLYLLSISSLTLLWMQPRRTCSVICSN